jgi:hypothetical protein
MPNENCDCTKCSVSLLHQVQFGILLGYKPCCIDNYCDAIPRDEEYLREHWKDTLKETPIWGKPHGKWFNKIRFSGKRKFTFISDWIRHHFEKVGMSKVWLCGECRETVMKHVYEQRNDWLGAKRKVIDFESRAFGEDCDPTLTELLYETHHRWDNEKVESLVKENPAEIFNILLENMDQ